MKTGIFAIYDSKAEAYLQPFFSQNKATAIRQFTQATQDGGTPFNKNPGDYTLFAIGTWDEQTAEIEQDEVKTPLGTAIEFMGTGE